MTKRIGALVVLWLSLAGVAQAQDLARGAPAMPPSGVTRITPRWDNYLFTGNHTEALAGGTSDVGGTLWASALSVTADFRDFVLAMNIPLAFTHQWFSTNIPLVGTTTNYSDQAELGNIELEGFANIDLGPEHRLLIGGGLALPTATDQVNPMSGRGFLTRQAAFHTAFRNPAAWADQAFTLWPTASYRYAIDWLLVHATGAIPIFFPTHGDYGSAVVGPPGGFFAPGEAAIGRGNVELMLTLEVGAAVRLGNLVDVGASFLGWALPSATGVRGNPDLGQTALAFSVRTDEALDFPLGAGFEWILDLDNAWGPSGGDRRFWGANFYVYGHFDVGSGGQITTSDFHPDDVEPVRLGPLSPGGSGGTGAPGSAPEAPAQTTTTP